MSRKSSFSTKLALGLSTFAIAGVVCWFAGTDEAQAGSWRMKNRGQGGISKVSGLKHRAEIIPRARTRLSGRKNAFRAKKKLGKRSPNRTTAARRFKSIAPVRGKKRLAIGRADPRQFQKLRTNNHTLKPRRIVNTASGNGRKKAHGFQYDPPRINRTKVQKKQQAAKRAIQTFNPAKGYGFIKPDGSGKDVFEHIPAVEAQASRSAANLDKELQGSRGRSKNKTKRPRNTLDNGIRLGAGPDFETGVSAAIPERQRLVFLKLLGLNRMPALDVPASIAPNYRLGGKSSAGRLPDVIFGDHGEIVQQTVTRDYDIKKDTHLEFRTGVAPGKDKSSDGGHKGCWSCGMTELLFIPHGIGPANNFVGSPETEDRNSREHIMLPRVVGAPFLTVSQNACYPDEPETENTCEPPEPEPIDCSNQSHPDC